VLHSHSRSKRPYASPVRTQVLRGGHYLCRRGSCRVTCGEWRNRSGQDAGSSRPSARNCARVVIDSLKRFHDGRVQQFIGEGNALRIALEVPPSGEIFVRPRRDVVVRIKVNGLTRQPVAGRRRQAQRSDHEQSSRAAFKCSSHSDLHRPHATVTALAASSETFSDRAATSYGSSGRWAMT
jgi:hypothetical protein